MLTSSFAWIWSPPRRFWPLPRPAPHCGEGGVPRPGLSRRFFVLPLPAPPREKNSFPVHPWVWWCWWWWHTSFSFIASHPPGEQLKMTGDTRLRHDHEQAGDDDHEWFKCRILSIKIVKTNFKPWMDFSLWSFPLCSLLCDRNHLEYIPARPPLMVLGLCLSGRAAGHHHLGSISFKPKWILMIKKSFYELEPHCSFNIGPQFKSVSDV